MKSRRISGTVLFIIIILLLFIAYFVIRTQRNNSSYEKALSGQKEILLTDDEYLSHSCFIGDSICLGLSKYEMLPAEQVIAQANMGVLSMGKYTFDGKDVIQAAAQQQPEYLYIWLGMNDFLLCTPEEYTKAILSLVQQLRNVLHASEITVLSITPMSAAHPLEANNQIDEYNAALKQGVTHSGIQQLYYLDISTPLKESESALNQLAPAYDGGDGMHLSAYAYPIILQEILASKMSG